jgi:hypothetical protein
MRKGIPSSVEMAELLAALMARISVAFYAKFRWCFNPDREFVDCEFFTLLISCERNHDGDAE